MQNGWEREVSEGWKNELFLIFSIFCVLQLLGNALLNSFSKLFEGVFHTVHVFSTLFTVVIYSVENEFNSAFPSNCSTQKMLKIKKTSLFICLFLNNYLLTFALSRAVKLVHYWIEPLQKIWWITDAYFTINQNNKNTLFWPFDSSQFVSFVTSFRSERRQSDIPCYVIRPCLYGKVKPVVAFPGF